MKKTIIKEILYIVYLILLIAFIFGNSFASIEESAEDSGRILAFINNILNSLRIPIEFSEFFIRKTAHFIEFFTLGASVFGYVVLFKKVTIPNVIYSIFTSCLIAMLDETIQYFTNRGSMLLDVWLDFFAALISIVLLYVLYRIKSTLKKT